MLVASNPSEVRRIAGKRNRKVRLPAIRPSRRVATGIRRKIESYMRMMTASVESKVVPTMDIRQVANTLEYEKRFWDGVFENAAMPMAREMSTGQNDAVKAAIIAFLLLRFKKEQLSISIFDEREVMEAMEVTSLETASLIRTIPSLYIGKVANAVFRDFKGEEFPEKRTLAEEIKHIGNVSTKRAEFIATDQIAKMNSMFVERQSKALGSESYVWKARMDLRTVGNPVGLYPKGNAMHNDHYHRDGEVFSWDNPPPDGHPGRPINCRCEAMPLIDISKIF